MRPLSRSRLAARYTLAACALALAGCSDPTSPQESELAAAQSRWRTVSPTSNSYVMRQQILCFCAFANSEFVVTVVNGAITSVVPAVPPQNGLPAPEPRYFRTIDQLFAEVHGALKKPGTLKEVTYDPVAGYPNRLSLDPVLDAIDDEVAYVTRGVGPVP
ncbi:DUF6174 domain-containing protein [Gemmatimonas aurantiaca]|uniref:DUF6174 domain-containing protein n=1 Tax=Gemmatimonas aurantiaca TaxID=173480 RepID=UPI00301D9EE8